MYQGAQGNPGTKAVARRGKAARGELANVGAKPKAKRKRKPAARKQNPPMLPIVGVGLAAAAATVAGLFWWRKRKATRPITGTNGTNGLRPVGPSPGGGASTPRLVAPRLPPELQAQELQFVLDEIEKASEPAVQTIVGNATEIGNDAFNGSYGIYLLEAGIPFGRIPPATNRDPSWTPWINTWQRMVDIARQALTQRQNEGWIVDLA